MSTTQTPNMSLVLPGVGSEAGPDFAFEINNALTLVDSHDHSIGKGVQITPAGMLINADLDISNNFLINVSGITLSAEQSPPGLSTIYEFGNDLYFVDGVGNDVRITQSGAVAGTPGSISNLVAPASASYVGASSSFVWESDTNKAADMDGGSVIIREKITNANGITLSSPASLAADYEVFLPTALPASQKFLTLSNVGVIASDWAVDNSTLEVATDTVQVKNLGITTAKIAAGAVTKAKLAALGQISSTAVASFTTASNTFVDVTNLTLSITVTGRPVILTLVGTGGASLSQYGCTGVAGNASGEIQFYDTTNAVALLTTELIAYPVGGVAAVEYPPSAFSFFFVPSAGTISYKVRARGTNAAAATMFFTNIKLLAFEL